MLGQLLAQQDPVVVAVPTVKVAVPGQKYSRELHGVSLLQSEPIAQHEAPVRPMMQYSELSQQTAAPTSKPVPFSISRVAGEFRTYMDADPNYNQRYY